MNIKKVWNKFLVWAEYKDEVKPIEEALREQKEQLEEIIKPPQFISATHKEAVRMKKGREAKPLLINAFYGTLIDRDPSDGSLKKKKHAHDGWREGFSHPFEFEGRTYDVQKRRDDSRAQFEELMARIEAMEGR
jgi:hypothetical protein